MRLTPTRRDEALRLSILVALSGFLFFFNLGSRVLWDVDEGTHAVVAKNIVTSGDWVTPTFNGENFYDKPILFSWLGAVAFRALGFTELAARLPGALLGLATVLVTFLLGRAMFGSTAGLLAGVVLATSAQFLIMSRAVVHDTALTLFTTLALALFWLGFREERGRGRRFLLFWLAVALAVLAKGPLGLVLPLLVIGLFLLATRRLDLVRSMRIVPGLLILLAVAGPWYLAISLRNPDYLPYFLLEKNLGSVVGRFHHTPKPITFYLGVLLGGILPWTVFLPPAIRRAWRARGAPGPQREAHLFLLLWAGLIFAFFSLMTSKRESYILPMIPAVALLLAVPWRDLLAGASESLRRSFRWSAAAAPALLLGLLAWVAVDPPTYAEAKVGLDVWRIVLVLVVATVLLAAAFWLLRLGKPRGAFLTYVTLVVVGLVLFSLVITPPVGPYKATRELGIELDRRLPVGERMVMYNRMRHSALFYTGREARTLHHRDRLVELLESDRREYCVISHRDLEKNRELVAGRYTILADVGNKYLISNRPDPPGDSAGEKRAPVPE